MTGPDGTLYIPNDGSLIVLPGRSLAFRLSSGVAPIMPRWEAVAPPVTATDAAPRGLSVSLDAFELANPVRGQGFVYSSVPTPEAALGMLGTGQGQASIQGPGQLLIAADLTAPLAGVSYAAYTFTQQVGADLYACMVLADPGFPLRRGAGWQIVDASWGISPSTVHHTVSQPTNPSAPFTITTDWNPLPGNTGHGSLTITDVVPPSPFANSLGTFLTDFAVGEGALFQSSGVLVGGGSVGWHDNSVGGAFPRGQALLMTPGTYTLYAVPSAALGLLPKVVSFTLVVDPASSPTPPPPPSSGRPAPPVNIVAGAIGLPTGGGSPRLYLLICRGVGQFPTADAADSTRALWGRITAVRCCVSFDFGATFRPGVDLEVVTVDDTPVVDGLEVGSIHSIQLGIRVLAGGRLYANGMMPGAATTATSQPSLVPRRPWKHALISDDLGATWEDASTLNRMAPTVDDPDTPGTTIFWPQLGWTCWRTRGGYEGSKGSGGRTGGPVRLLSLAQKVGSDGYTLGVRYWAESLDEGDTWRIATDLGVGGQFDGALAGDGWPPLQWPPQPYFGVSVERVWSYDDFQSTGGLGDFNLRRSVQAGTGTGGALVQSAGVDSLYWISAGYLYRASGLPIDPEGTDPVTLDHFQNHAVLTPTRKPLQWSRTKDGLNLAPIPFHAPADVTSYGTDVAFHWPGRIILVNPVDEGGVVQVYETNNDGDWFYKRCHSGDGGARWVED